MLTAENLYPLSHTSYLCNVITHRENKMFN
nr:MAG TPA: hypothetical protein [Caudoviricetes sp.]